MLRQPASSLDLFTDSIRLMGDATMIAVMEFDRRLDVPRLEAAASRCLDAFPILSSRMIRGRGPAYWEYQGRFGGDDAISVQTIDGNDYRPYVPHAMDPYGCSQSKVRILRTPDRDVVVITLAHAAADGLGLMTVANCLLNAYLEPSSVQPSGEGLPVRDTLWTENFLESNDCLEDIGGLEMDSSLWPSLCGSSREGTSYHRMVISQEDVLRLKSVANVRGGTINDVLLSAYFLSLSDLTGHNGPQAISFPVNLRQHLNDGSRIMSNQAGNISFQIRREPGDRMDATLAKVIKETRRLKTGMVGVREQVAFDRFCDPKGEEVHRMVEEIAAKQRGGLANIFISNPGPFPLPAVDGLVDAYVCYPGSIMPATCFVVSTFRGSMTVTMGYQNGDEPRGATEKALHRFAEHLPVDISLVRFS